MKNILNKIYIHPIFLITLLLFILMGQFRFLFYFMLLITLHEIGHLITSIIFKWNINKIIILPFGALIKYEEKINRPLKEEFIIAISGIIFQIIFYYMLTLIFALNYKYLSAINIFIIIINIIPIYPLDGSKVISVILNILTSYKNSINLTIIISYIFISIISIKYLYLNKIIYIYLYFLFKETFNLYKKRKDLFNKFLLERYIYEYNFKKEKKINKIEDMKKDYRHIFYINKRYITEKTFLRDYFSIK